MFYSIFRFRIFTKVLINHKTLKFVSLLLLITIFIFMEATPIFNKASEYFSITYVTGIGNDARTYRYRIGQPLRTMNATVYEIANTSKLFSNKGHPIAFDKQYTIYIISHATNSVIEWKSTNSYDELVNNVEYMVDRSQD